MKVVLDTNIYISSLVFKGKAEIVYDTILENTQVFISDYIILEISDTLYRKFSISRKSIRLITSSILSVVKKVEVNTHLPSICRDQDDNNILQLCESVSADFLITGDKDLLIIRSFKSTLILSPADFMESFG